jgi:predicted ester cyclase
MPPHARRIATAIGRRRAEGDRVALRWTLTGTHLGPYGQLQPTGKRIEVAGVFLCRVANGKIAESWGVWDTASVMRQLGVA